MRFSPDNIKNIFTVFVAIVTMLGFGLPGFAREITVSERAWSGGETAEFSAPKNFPFVVAGGKVLGSSTPMRAYLTIEGVATGDGVMSAVIDGNLSSRVDIAFPGGSDTREFSIVIPDVAGVLEHTSAGTYDHTLQIDPGGATVGVGSVHVSNTYTWDIGFDCPEGSATTTKQKTIQKLIASDIDLASPKDLTISYDLVEDITGISNHVQSAYVEVVGDYTGAGTLSMTYPENGSLTETHDLPASDGPRQVSLLSADSKALFQSSTSSSHVFNLTASGPTMTNVSAKLVLTYIYHPAAVNCGGYPATGEISSEVLDTRIQDPLYNSITYRGELGGPQKNIGRVRFQIAGSKCANGATNYPACNAGSWEWVGGASCGSSDWFESAGSGVPIDFLRTGCLSLFDGKQYYRYKVQICSLDCIKQGPTTPTVNEVFVSWSP
jgi:hypothetical protein